MSNKLTQAVLPLILLFSPGGWAAVSLTETRDITIPAWSTDSVYGDNTVYEMNLMASDITLIGDNAWFNSTNGGIYLEPFPANPSPGDKRCLDNDCNYYLDISEINAYTSQSGFKTFDGSWGSGGRKGLRSGGKYGVWGSAVLTIKSSSKIKIRKRNEWNAGQAVLPSIPSTGKIVTISVTQCAPGLEYYYESTCNRLNAPYPGHKLTLNIHVPAPTLPQVQCYMSPWSNNIAFQPVTVPAEKSKAGQATWPLGGGGFTGVEAQSASLSVNCNNIDAGITSFPLKVGLSGTNWEYGQNGELYFNNERSIAVAANLKMEATGNGTLSLDTVRNAACQNYWSPSGANAFEMGPARLGQYLSANESACQFTHTLPTARNIVEGFRFTLNAILGVSTQPLAAEPGYGEHTGALMLEVNSL